MCFSAQIEESWAKYMRDTGAQIDFDQFIEIFGIRAQEPSIRIPRAVDRWFDHPKTTAETRIKELIDAYRSARITSLEKEIFAQRKRLADAERKLAEKETRAALESRRIATAKAEKALRDLPLYKDSKLTRLDGRIFPMQYVPIVMMAEGRPVVRLARYHCRLAGKPASADRQFPGLYNARRDNIDKYWRTAFGTSHALMLATSFFENVNQAGRNVVLHFKPEPAETMLIACVYSVWKDPAGGRELLSFAAVTDDPPAEVAAAGHDRIIINLSDVAARRWLTPEGRSPEELQAVLDDRQRPFYTHEILAA